jgi:hypothetical protein
MLRNTLYLVVALAVPALAQAPATVAPAVAPKASEVKTIRLLTVGNSFSGNATRYLSQIVASVEGCQIRIARADIGGCSLDKHWALAEKSETDPECKPYTHGGKTYNLKEMLQLEPWDVVTLQQVSNTSFVEESYQPAADQLCAYIRQHAPQAKVMIHQTWAYGVGNERLTQWNMTPRQMHDGLVACYAKLATHLQCSLLPSGAAFQIALQKQPDLSLYDSAAYHANEKGCYLGGCVWFGALFGTSPEKVSFLPQGVSAAEAELLRQAAAAALVPGSAPAEAAR